MVMENGKRPERTPSEIIEAFERERERVRELQRRHTENVRNAHTNDRQVLIERRRRPR
jgi:hypothetical protein